MIRSHLSKRFAARASVASPRRRLRTPLVGLIVAMFVAALMAAPSAPEAQAYRVSKTGYPGSVQVSLAYTGPGGLNELGPYVSVNPRTIGESPQYASRAQHIMITYRLWDYMMLNFWPYDEKWVISRQLETYGNLTAAQTSLRDQGVYIPDRLNNERFGFDIVVKWYLSTGQLIGTKTIDYDVGPYGEFRCASSAVCSYNTAIDWIKP